MSGGVVTYAVTEPQHPWELRSLLLSAADSGRKAEFEAMPIAGDTSNTGSEVFVVRVTAAQFTAPVAFDLLDQEGRYVQIRLYDDGRPMTFDVIG